MSQVSVARSVQQLCNNRFGARVQQVFVGCMDLYVEHACQFVSVIIRASGLRSTSWEMKAYEGVS